MKNLKKSILLMMVLFFGTNYAQNVCPGNLWQNGDLETGIPTAWDEDIINAAGYTRMWATGIGLSAADYYNATTTPIWVAGVPQLPVPASGNYGSFWVRNVGTSLLYREGFINNLNTALPANSGAYNLNFDLASLRGNGIAQLAVYGINKAPAALAPNPTSLFVPGNMNLFPGNMVLLGTININGPNSPTKVNQNISFTTNGNTFPITSVMLTHSDNATGGLRYIAVDDFCLTQIPPGDADYCCEEAENLVPNGHFESGVTFTSDYNYNSNPFPGEYAVGNRAQALSVSPQWDVEDHSNCSIGSTNTNFLMVNGKTQQLAGTESVVWRENFYSGIPDDPENCETFKFCANFKNMPQCAFDILPQVAIRIMSTCGAYQTPFTTINTTTGMCDWQLISTSVSASGMVDIEIVLLEDGNGDGNDLAIDDISFQMLQDPNYSLAVQRQSVPFEQITASLNSMSPSDDILLCPPLETAGYEYMIAEFTALPPLSNINWATAAYGNSFTSWGFSATGAPWLLTTTFPGYNVDPSKNYVVVLRTFEEEDCCYAESLTARAVTQEYESFIIEDEEGNFEELLNEANMEFKTDLGDDNSELVNPKSLLIYPNPVSNTLNYELSNGEVSSISVIDLIGNNVEFNSSNESNAISLEHLSSGTYILTVTDINGKIHSQKFVKK